MGNAEGNWRAALLYLALTLLLAYPLAVSPARSVLADAPDTHLFMWTLAWDTHAFVHHPLSLFDANIYHPQRRTLAYSENLIGSALFAAPILWLTDNPVLALNVIALLSCVLCGLGAYVLARRVGIGAPGATLCGLIFAFSPPRFFRIGQLHLAPVQWVPFTLAFLHAYLDGGRRRDLRLAAACFTLQALTSGHGAAFATVSVVGLVAYRVALGEPPALVRRLRDLGASGALLLAPAVLVVLPYRRVQVEMGLKRSLDGWGPTWESFLASPTRVHAFLLSLVPDARINDAADAFLFPGYLPLLLAAVAFLWRGARLVPPTQARRLPLDVRPRLRRWRDAWQRWAQARRRDMTTFYGLLTLVSVWLSVGPPIGLWPLVYWLPGLNFIRVPSRFMVLAVLGVAVLAGMGFERVSAALAPKRRLLLATTVGAALVAEFAAIPLPVVPYRVEIPAVDHWLAHQPKPFVVAEVPVIPAERYQSAYTLHSMAHWQKTVHGYSGLRPPLHTELYSQLRHFPDETSLQRLLQLGVGYIVVHSDMYPPGEWTKAEERIGLFREWLRLDYLHGAGRVYSLLRPPADAQR